MNTGNKWIKNPLINDSAVILHMGWFLRKEAQAVVFTRDNGKILFLLVHKRNGWRIPRGGVEEGESFEETIKRELWEEVSIMPGRVHVLEKFNEYMYEDAKAEILHNPNAFLVFVPGKPEVTPDNEEINGAKWVDYRTAIRMLRFNEEKNTVRQAMGIIKRIPPESLSRLEAESSSDHP